MIIAIGCDHAGLRLKAAIASHLGELGHEVVDVGTFSDESVDYPDYVVQVATLVREKRAALGIFACGSGLGPAIAANKLPGIRSAPIHDVYSARSARRDNDANLLTIGERVIGVGAALEVITAFVNEPFSGAERHQRRIDKITELEHRFGPSRPEG